jgi:hypothetical protein
VNGFIGFIEFFELAKFIGFIWFFEFVELGTEDQGQIGIALEAVINQPAACYLHHPITCLKFKQKNQLHQLF